MYGEETYEFSYPFCEKKVTSDKPDLTFGPDINNFM